jgi:hypothetical protein
MELRLKGMRSVLDAAPGARLAGAKEGRISPHLTNEKM